MMKSAIILIVLLLSALTSGCEALQRSYARSRAIDNDNSAALNEKYKSDDGYAEVKNLRPEMMCRKIKICMGSGANTDFMAPEYTHETEEDKTRRASVSQWMEAGLLPRERYYFYCGAMRQYHAGGLDVICSIPAADAEEFKKNLHNHQGASVCGWMDGEMVTLPIRTDGIRMYLFPWSRWHGILRARSEGASERTGVPRSGRGESAAEPSSGSPGSPGAWCDTDKDCTSDNCVRHKCE